MALSVRQSGAFWKDAAGTIVGWPRTTCGPGSGNETEWVYGVPSILIDGKKQPETQHLFLGGVEEWEISDDGSEVRNRSGNNDPTATAAVFLGSLAQAAEAANVDARLPDTEAGEPLNMQGLIGLRVRLGQVDDEKATAKIGKRKSKRGQEYERTNTVVSRVYGRAETTATPATSSAARTPRGTAPQSTFNIDERATDIVLNLLKEAPARTTTKSKIRVPVINLTASDKELAPYR